MTDDVKERDSADAKAKAAVESRLSGFGLQTVKPVVLVLASLAMAIAAVRGFFQAYAFLLFAPSAERNLDVLVLKHMGETLFAGIPLYENPKFLDFATYPPASFVLLYPFLGLGDDPTTRWIWAVVGAFALAGFVWAIVKMAGLETWQERTFLALTILSMNGTRAALGNGQPVFLSLFALAGALLLLNKPHPGRRDEALAGLLLIVALLKPQLVVPFLWFVLFAPGGVRVLAGVCAGYAAVTLFATSFQSGDLLTLMKQWLERASYGAMFVREGNGNSNNVSLWLGRVGLQSWSLPVSASILLTLGVWTYVYRETNRWVKLGMAAVVGRVAIYHRFYDDPMLVFGVAALLAIGTTFRDGKLRSVAWVLLALMLVGLVGYYTLRVFSYYEADAAVLLLVIGFLWIAARRESYKAESMELRVVDAERVTVRSEA
jgi:hypothetical protein